VAIPQIRVVSTPGLRHDGSMTNVERLAMAVKVGSIAIDLDGTLAHQDPGAEFDPKVIGDPVPKMLARVKRWLKAGEDVKLFTARASDEKNIPPIRKWLDANGLSGITEITNEKTPDIEELWDDRAVGIEANTGKIKSGRLRLQMAQVFSP